MIWKLLLAVVVGLVVAELRGWLRPAADFIVERASARLRDPAVKERYVAEWKAELDSLDDRRLTQLVTAARMFHRAAATNVALGHEPVQKRMPWVAVRRTRDVLVAGCLLIFYAPALTFLAVAVLLSSGGPVLERHWSLGRDGAPYQRLRFRTSIEVLRMVPLLENDDGKFPLGNIRIRNRTGVGHVLERIHVHELPGLWNVLRGHLSLGQFLRSSLRGLPPSQCGPD